MINQAKEIKNSIKSAEVFTKGVLGESYEDGGVVWIDGKPKSQKTDITLSLALASAVDKNERLCIITCELTMNEIHSKILDRAISLGKTDLKNSIEIINYSNGTMKDEDLQDFLVQVAREVNKGGVFVIDHMLFSSKECLNKFLCSFYALFKSQHKLLFINSGLDLESRLTISHSKACMIGINTGEADSNFEYCNAVIMNK